MKQLSKIMIAAVASVALAAPAFAWDFSASGSSSVTFNKTDVTAYTGATAGTGGGVASDGGAITLSSSHTDGAKTASFSYALDWDGNLDETVSMSGSNKVGNWTASGSVSYNRANRGGCSNAADNGTTVASAPAACGATGQVAEKSEAAITLTDGTMTIVFGNAGHLSGQNVSSGGAAAGQTTMDEGSGGYAVGAEAGVGAMVGTYQGVSLGYAISDTMSVTGAYQASSATGDLMGTGEFLDGETAASHGTTGFGIGFSGTFGPATIGFTQASASTADGTGDADLSKLSTSWSTMGLGVAIDLGDIDPFISYGSGTGSAGSAANKTVAHTHSGSEFGLTYALGTDSVVLLVGSTSDQTSTTDKPLVKSFTELGYSTTVGPASLSVGYGSVTHADADKVEVAGGDGYASTDIEVAMGFSF